MKLTAGGTVLADDVYSVTSGDTHRRIALSARMDFEERLNWRVAGGRLHMHISHALDRHRAGAVSPGGKPSARTSAEPAKVAA